MTETNLAETIITARGVSKHVFVGDQRIDILNSVSLEIKAGESVAIAGASGSGKTTLLGLLAGLDHPSAGDIALAGQPLGTLDEEGRALLRSRLVGFVFQNFQLLNSLTARENVMLPLELKGRDDALARADATLGDVGLAHRLHHYPYQLSGGEQQRLALARAFAGDPAILFADEPTGNLDTRTGAEVAELLFRLNAGSRTTLVLVTHDQALATRCHRQLRLDGGRLVDNA